jgi:uncharacterized protein (TIGR03083 family)
MVLDYLTIIAEESERMHQILLRRPLDARVPGCPDWNLGELGAHICDVQNWCTGVLQTGRPNAGGIDLSEEEAIAGFPDITAKLIVQLEQSDPEQPCWNFTAAPQTMAFWFRRQALEVGFHRWDAASAVSVSPEPIAAELAANMVDEFVNILGRRVNSREDLDVAGLVGRVHLHCTDTPGDWTFGFTEGQYTVSNEPDSAGVTLSGTASDLALTVYNRSTTGSLEVAGDSMLLERWRRAFSL